MPEPTTVSAGAGGAVLVAIAMKLMGPSWGPLAATATGGLVGALISLSAVDTGGSRLAAARYLLTYALFASLAAGGISYLISQIWHVATDQILVLVALGVGLVGGQWRDLIVAIVAAVKKFVTSRAEGRAS